VTPGRAASAASGSAAASQASGSASPLDAALLLDNQLCFLVARLHRALNDRYRPVIGRLGLTYPQYLAMLVLWESEPASVGRLGERLHLDSGTLSPLLKRLEASGLVTRTRDAGDERSVQVRLTDAGRALKEQARDVPAWIGSCIAGTLDEYVRVRAELTDILGRVEAAAAEPVPEALAGPR
jgi:MarR family transcriptional regulator, organic hydroperoxide resistance regulator